MDETTQALQVIQPSQDMAMSLKQIGDRVNLVHQVLEKVMRKGTHYGVVPGCGDKKVLLKPGADVLAMTFRLVPQFSVTRTELENGHREYDVTCTMHGADGGVLGQGVGSCSTMEKKYRYRKDQRGQKVENEDIADVYNTVLKMAKKRAHVDATLTVTGAADLFTQDLIEDEDDGPAKTPVTMPVAHPTAPTAPPMREPNTEAQMDTPTVTGRIGRFIKKGDVVNGKERKSYSVQVCGEYYSTFKDDLGSRMADLANSEGDVDVKWHADGKFRVLDDIRAAVLEAPSQATESEEQ